MRSRRFFIFTTIIFLTSGCRISENHSIFREGQLYQTTVESFAVFQYAAFIWQDPRDYQKIGYLYPFKPWPVAQLYQQQIKEKNAMEFKGSGNIIGGWAIYVPVGTKFRVSQIYSYIPRIDKTITVEVIFLDGKIKGKYIKLSPQFEDCNGVMRIKTEH